MKPADPNTLLAYLQTVGQKDERLVHLEQIPGRTARNEPWPQWVDPAVSQAFGANNIPTLWSHQSQALNALAEGQNVVISTGTGSGKSLPAWVPILSDLMKASTDTSLAGYRKRPTAIYMAPTKALSADQLDTLNNVAADLPYPVQIAPADGDTSTEVKRWARAYADIVLTNPDYVHHVLLSGHDHWTRFLRSLKYIILDELHYWRGVSGSHVAFIMRRLLRLARSLGANPQVIMLSATVRDPAVLGAGMIGDDQIVAVTEDGSPAAPRALAFWQPALHPAEKTKVRKESTELVPEYAIPTLRVSPWTEAANLGAAFIERDARMLTFVLSRYGAEAVSEMTKKRLSRMGSTREGRVSAYRGGYLPEERRELEKQLREGELQAVATTNALELGIDISGLDATITCEWPGSRASLMQQVGRAGRAGRSGVSVFIAGENPLDNYLVNHPQEALSQVENNVLDLTNPYVLSSHICAAAYEKPIQEDELGVFGLLNTSLLDALTAQGFLWKRPTGWHWNHGLNMSPHDMTDIRGGSGDVQIVNGRTGEVIGTVPEDRADSEVFPDAIYVHQGKTFHVLELSTVNAPSRVGPDRGEGDDGEGARGPGSAPRRKRPARVAVVEQVATPLRTRPAKHTDVTILQENQSWTSPDGLVTWHTGDVEVRTWVTDYDLLREPHMEFIANYELSLPQRVTRTVAVWYTLNPGAMVAAGVEGADLPGALHGAEHSAIGMLPLVGTCDRWDLGGLSIAQHTQTELPTVFVYDALRGGAGYAEHGFRHAKTWITRTAQVVEQCGCPDGCPSCIQSPKCGNRNDPLSKEGSVALLRFLRERAPGV